MFGTPFPVRLAQPVHEAALLMLMTKARLVWLVRHVFEGDDDFVHLNQRIDVDLASCECLILTSSSRGLRSETR